MNLSATSATSDETEGSQLENPSRFFEDILDSVNAAIIRLRVYENAEWQYDYISKGCETLFGYTAEELLTNSGLWRSQIFPGDFSESDFAQRLQQIYTEQTATFEYRFYHKDGEIRWISNTLNAQYLPDQGYWIATVVEVDITRRMQLEMECQRLEDENSKEFIALQAALLDQVQNAAIATNLEGHIIYYNQAAQKLYQLTPEVEQPLSSIVPPDHSTSVEEMMAAILSTDTWSGELLVQRLNGVRFLADVTGSLIRDRQSSPWAMVMVSTDITERKQAELALQEGQRFAQTVADALPGILYIYDLSEQRILYTNREIFDLLGYTPDALMQMEPAMLRTLIHPDDLHPCSQYERQLNCLQDGEALGFECRIRHCNGEWQWLCSQTTVLTRSGTGKVQQVLGIFIDITERKLAEQALRDLNQDLEIRVQHRTQELQQSQVQLQVAQERLNHLLSSSPSIIYSAVPTAAADATFISSNATNLLGYELSDFFQPNFWINKIHPDHLETIQLHLSEALHTGHYTLEYQFLHKDGSYRWLFDQARLVRDHLGRPLEFVGAATDISDRKQYEVERQQSEIYLRESLQEKEVLLREIHHRVKNNLQMVISLLNLQATTIDDPKVLQKLNESQGRISVMALIHEKLYQSDNLAKINFADYARSIIEDVFYSYTQYQSKIKHHIELEELDLTIDLAIPCGLILHELVSNAMKYAFPGERTGTVTVQFFTNESELYVIRVSDNGIGLLDKDSSQTSDSLGLQLVNAFIHKLRGTLKIEQTQGSCFELKFPAQKFYSVNR